MTKSKKIYIFKFEFKWVKSLKQLYVYQNKIVNYKSIKPYFALSRRKIMKQNMKKIAISIFNNNKLRDFIYYLKSKERCRVCLFVIKTRNN